MDAHILVMTNLPDALLAEQIARSLLEQKLIACANILPGIKSLYRWQETVETADECALWLKTTGANYDEVEQQILLHHPYALPEVIALPIVRGLPGYLNWIEAETRRNEYGKS